ncbi:MAG: ABC transporter permease [Bacteroidota bacterium]
MWQYLIKRLLLMVPTVWLISVLAFFISHKVGLSPVINQCGSVLTEPNMIKLRDCQRRAIDTFNLDKPPFYFSLHSWADPDTLHHIIVDREKAALSRLLQHNGQWALVNKWRVLQQSFLRKNLVFKLPQDSLTDDNRSVRVARLKTARRRAFDLQYYGQPKDLKRILSALDSLYSLDAVFVPLVAERQKLVEQLHLLETETNRWGIFVPRFKWNGFDNQYHAWLAKVIKRGDFGYSMKKANISQTIGSLFFYTAFLALLGTLLVLGLGIPMGILAARKKDGWWDRFSAILVFAFRAVPEFWLGLVLLMFFANPDFANWFDSSFVPSNPTTWKLISRYILPTIAYSYGSLAVVSRVVRANMLEQLSSDYVRTARTKGLSQKRVLYGHALRNALIPLVTLISGLFPAMIGGSLILETVFQIPGLGKTLFESIINNDAPVILAMFSLLGLLTMIGYWVTDVLYHWLDPRITLNRKN